MNTNDDDRPNCRVVHSRKIFSCTLTMTIIECDDYVRREKHDPLLGSAINKKINKKNPISAFFDIAETP